VFGATDALAQSDVSLCPITIRTTDGEMRGLAFPAHQRATFEATLYANAAPTTVEHDTNRERTIKLDYAPSVGTIQIEPVGFINDAMAQRALKAASRRHNGTPIVFRDMENMDVPPSQVIANTIKGVLVLYRARQLETTPFKTSSLYGRTLDGRKDFVIARPQGTRHIIDDDGTVVAEVFGNVAYILGDFLRYDDETLGEPIARLLHECVSTALMSNDMDDELAALWRASNDKHRDEYINVRFRTFEAKKREFEAEIASCDADMEAAQKKITAAVRKRHSIVTRLTAFTGSECPNERERLQKEFDQLVASPYISSVSKSRMV
jgi:hypothetical protein